MAQMQVLRSSLRAKGSKLKIAKVRLMKLAIDGMSGVCELDPFLKDQVGLVFASKEFSDVAKILSDFSKEHEALSLVGGCLDSQVISKEKVVQIASLPSRDVLLAMVCGTMSAPMTGLISVLKMPIYQLLWTLQQAAAKKK